MLRDVRCVDVWTSLGAKFNFPARILKIEKEGRKLANFPVGILKREENEQNTVNVGISTVWVGISTVR